jgi:hypothetical protein
MTNQNVSMKRLCFKFVHGSSKLISILHYLLERVDFVLGFASVYLVALKRSQVLRKIRRRRTVIHG